MKYLVWSIIPIAIYVLYYFAMKKSLASHVANLAKEQFIIRPPRMYIAVSVIASLIFVAFFVYCMSRGDPAGVDAPFYGIHGSTDRLCDLGLYGLFRHPDPAHLLSVAVWLPR